MSISKNKAWVLGAALLSLAILVASWFLVIGPKRAQAADLATDTLAAEAHNEEIRQQTELLKTQFATLPDEIEKLEQIRSQFPAQSEVPNLLRTLEGYAASSGVTLTAIQPGAVTAYAPAADPTATDATATKGTGLSAIPLTLTVAGTFPQTELFVKQAQVDMSRYFLLDTVALSNDDSTASGSSSSVTTTIGGKIFILPDTTATTTDATTTDVTTTVTGETATTTTSVSGDTTPAN